MNYDKFRSILIDNQSIEADVERRLIEFSNSSGYNPNDRVSKLMRYFGEELNAYVFQIPIKNKEFGAFYFEDDVIKCLILNANQPKNMMYFTFAHELYHMLNGAKDRINERKREIVLTDAYYEDLLERKASLFASKLLMPEVEFLKIYRLYNSKCDEIQSVVIELMYYFETTYIGVILRLCELGILEDSQIIKDLIAIDKKEIKKLFDKLWLNKDILEPSKTNEMQLILNKIKNKGHILVEEGYISENTLKEKIRSSQQLLMRITGDQIDH